MVTPNVASVREKTTYQWSPSNYALVRLAGKPYEDFTHLRLEKTAALIEEMIEHQRFINTEREILCDQIYECVGRQTDSDVKSQLVACKREIYNQRSLKTEDYPLLADCLGAEYAAAVSAYYQVVERLEAVTLEARETFALELGEKRGLLQKAMHDENFLHSLILSQPLLYHKLQKNYLRANPRDVKAKERKIEDKVFRYFARMTTKTSPFARFGPVALAEVGGETTSHRVSSMATTSRVEFNQEVAAYLIAKLSQIPEFQAQLYPRINPTMHANGQNFRLWATKIIESDTQLGRAQTYRALNTQPILLKLLQLLEEHQDGMLTFSAYLDLVKPMLPDDGEQAQKIIQFIYRLVASGVIVLEFAFKSDRFERIAELREQVERMETAPETEQQLQKLEMLVDQYATANLAEKAQLIRDITGVIEALTHWHFNEDETGYADFILEDASVPGVQVQLGEDFFGAFQDDMNLLLDCLLARDQHGNGYHLLRDVFTRLYGEGGEAKDLLQFTYEYAQAFSENWYSSPNFPRIQDWQQRLQTYMAELARFSEGKEFDVTPAFHTLLDLFETPSAPMQSLVVIAQVVAESWEALQKGDFLIVVNSVLPGFGHFYSRYCPLFEEKQLADRISETLETYQAALPPGEEVVEVLSVLNNNAQIHPAFTPRQIVPPDEQSSLPQHQQLSIQQLSLKHDPLTDDLALWETGVKRLHPVYMGFFHTFALYGLHRVLADLSVTGHHFDHLKPSAYPYLNTKSVEPGEVRHHPRLRIGKVVLQRKSWVVDVQTLNALLDDDPFKTFANFLTWADDHQLPKQVFLRVGHFGFSASSGDGQSKQFNPTQHKPMLIDFRNFFTIRQLIKLLEAFENVSQLELNFEEVLPDHHFFEHQQQTYVVELQMQFDLKKDEA